MIIDDKKSFLKICPNGRLMALDVGTKNIGIAITSDTRKICVPSETIRRQGNKKDFITIKRIIGEKKIVGIVVGLPLSFNNEENKISKFIRNFTNNLSNFIDLPIMYQDERLSSFEAEELMRDYDGIKNVIDKIAASYILEDFTLDL
jgi:putative Holliday junction resolvase